MRIAILGAGFAGLAVTWYLLHYTQGSISIDLYDPRPIGENASGISSGLLHSYPGKEAKLAWQAEKGLREVHRLLTEASRALGKSVVTSKGILRPALSAEQVAHFKHAAKQYPDTQWWDAERCMQTVAGLSLPESGGGLFIREGLTLNPKDYLQGLWQACARLGTQHYQSLLKDPEKIASYDRIVLATGAYSKYFPVLKDLPVSLVKGQLLELQWPLGLTPLPLSLVSHKYLVMRTHPVTGQHTCLVGSTFEHNYTSEGPDLKIATEEILPKVAQFFPALQQASILQGYSAIRASGPNHLPLVGRLLEKYYFFTGLGSRGLLYHGWVGKRVARAVLTQDLSHFPSELNYSSK